MGSCLREGKLISTRTLSNRADLSVKVHWWKLWLSWLLSVMLFAFCCTLWNFLALVLRYENSILHYISMVSRLDVVQFTEVKFPVRLPKRRELLNYSSTKRCLNWRLWVCIMLQNRIKDHSKSLNYCAPFSSVNFVSCGRLSVHFIDHFWDYAN